MLSDMSSWGMFLIGVAWLALPAVLAFAAKALFGWRYGNTVERHMNQRGSGLPNDAVVASAHEESGPARQSLTLRQVEAPAPSTSIADDRRREALQTAIRVRWTFAVAGSVQMASTAMVIHGILSGSSAALVYPPVLTAYLTMLPGGVLLAAFAVRETRSRVAFLATYLIVGVGVLVLGPDHILANGPNVVISHLRIALRNSVMPLLGVAMLLARRLRPILLAVAAYGIYLLIGTEVFGFFFGREVMNTDPRLIPVSALWLGLASTCLGAAVLFRLLRQHRPIVPIVALLAVIVSVAWAVDRWLSLSFPLGQLALGIASNALQWYVLWLIFQGFVRLQEQRVIPSEILHWDLCWLFLALVTKPDISVFLSLPDADLLNSIGQGQLLALAPFACNVLVLHTALHHHRRVHPDRPGRRLLLLRVFGDRARRVRLVDMLGEAWRRAGCVNYIAGTDLAQRHVAARALEAFVRGRLQTLFLKSPDEVDEGVGSLRERREMDLRYPINELYCYADAWQYAVRSLAPESDVVLMDLRGFTSQNLGCVFELGVLVQTVPLKRIILLTDWTTDMRALSDAMQSAWQVAPAGSVNIHLAQPTVIVITFTGKTQADRELLESWLFSIVFGATATSQLPFSRT
ncbi:hypothetical protein [Paraburkholderia caribensis]|uniref:hypothetical protein n=1 Tax=Paraburkholderia caribensis TaxID=75105 RepID=UPI0034D20B2C